MQQVTEMKSLLLDDENPFNLNSQYHNCWLPGSARNQGINRHDIDPVILEY